jgi:predicted NBD/HSP70 family sugar kinase
MEVNKEQFVNFMDMVKLDVFLDRIKNPVSKCVMHDDATNAAALIEMWRGVAETLYSAIVEGAGGEGMEAYEWARSEERKIIQSLSYQGPRVER